MLFASCVVFRSSFVRLFYFHHGGRLYVVTSGFMKKAGKTDSRELQRAVRLMRQVKESDNENV